MKFARKTDFSRLPAVLVRWYRGRRRRIELGADLIRMTERGLFGAAAWSESPAAFSGVRRRAAMRGGVPIYHIDLLHPDRRKSLRLARIRGLAASREVWAGAARSLVLPTIDDTPAGPITRDAGEPDRPIRVLAARGRVPEAALDSAEPPFPLAFHNRNGGAAAADRLFLPGTAREVVVPMLDPAAAVALTLFLAVSGFLSWSGYPAEGVLQTLITVTRYLAGIGFVVTVAVLALLAGERRHVVITPRSITVGSALFGRRRRGVTVPFDTLHTVVLPKPKVPIGACTEIQLAGPDVAVTVPGLTLRQATWLGRLIMAAAAGREIAVAPARAADAAHATVDGAAAPGPAGGADAVPCTLSPGARKP